MSWKKIAKVAEGEQISNAQEEYKVKIYACAQSLLSPTPQKKNASYFMITEDNYLSIFRKMLTWIRNESNEPNNRNVKCKKLY